MKIFTSQAEWRSKLESAETARDAAVADLEAADAQLTTANGRIQELEQALAESRQLVATRDTELATARAATEAVQAELATAQANVIPFEQRAAQVAVEIVAEAGHSSPVANVESGNGSNVMTYTAFLALPHHERNAFIRGGGKIQD